MGWLSLYLLLWAHSDCHRTFYCLRTMLIMVALKQCWNFTRQYSVPRTANWQRDLPLSDRGTGADLQCKQCPLLQLGWAGVSCPSLLLFPGTCSRVCHSSKHLCKARTAVVGCAESCCHTAPSQGDPTPSCFHPSGEPSTSILASWKGWKGQALLWLPLTYRCSGAWSHQECSLLKENSGQV